MADNRADIVEELRLMMRGMIDEALARGPGALGAGPAVAAGAQTGADPAAGQPNAHANAAAAAAAGAAPEMEPRPDLPGDHGGNGANGANGANGGGPDGNGDAVHDPADALFDQQHAQAVRERTLERAQRAAADAVRQEERIRAAARGERPLGPEERLAMLALDRENEGELMALLGETRKRNAVSAAGKGKLPPLRKWDGKDAGRRADTFLEDVELYARHDLQDNRMALQLHLDGQVREHWQNVKARWGAEMPAWDEVKRLFKQMVGQTNDLTAHTARRMLVDNKVQQGARTVDAYLTDFESKLVLCTDVPVAFAAEYFVAGLKPALRALCQVNAQGLPFATVQEAVEFARGQERMLSLRGSHATAAAMQGSGRNRSGDAGPSARGLGLRGGRDNMGARGGILKRGGASESFADSAWLQQQGFALQPDTTITVQTASGQQHVVHTAVHAKLKLGSKHVPIKLRPIDNLLTGMQVIVGMDFMKAHPTVLNCEPKSCRVQVNGTWVHVPLSETHADPAKAAAAWLKTLNTPLSAKQAAKAVKRGCMAWMVLVQHEEDNHATLGAMTGQEGVEVDPELLALRKSLEALRAEYADVFGDLTDLPPADRPVQHEIPTIPGSKPSYRSPYRMSQAELAECKRQVDELLAKGFIEPCNSPYGAPVIFVRKRTGELRMCTDVRQLNSITLKQRWPMPRIDALLEALGKARCLSSLDMVNAYMHIGIKAEDQHKASFVTEFGQYCYKVMCFGLVGAPSTFNRFMATVFQKHIRAGYLFVYLDDLLIGSATPEEHLRHLREVFDTVRANKLRLKASKCEWGQRTLKFLGHIVGNGQVACDPAKVEVLVKWPVPGNLDELRRFLGTANYFKKFVRDYSSIAAPLTDLTSAKRASVFAWKDWPGRELQSFTELKVALTSPPVLVMPDYSKPFVIVADASMHGTGAVLLQEGRAVAYTSRKFTAAERNYTTTEQEMLALIHALQAWRCHVDDKPVVLHTDHHPLKYLKTQPHLSRRQARWMQFLEGFDYDIQPVKGSDNVADLLSRNPEWARAAWVCVLTRAHGVAARAGGGDVDDMDIDADNEQVPVPFPPRQRRLRPDDADPMVMPDEVHAEVNDLMGAILGGYQDDPLFSDPSFTAGLERDEFGLWVRGDQMVVPDTPGLRQQLLSEGHDTPSAGHRGVHKTLDLVTRTFWWPGVRGDVKQYVRSCPVCQAVKASSRLKGGLLQPLPIPEKRWQSVSVDLIVKLPRARSGHDSILVFVDRLTKYAIFVPVRESMKAADFAQRFIVHVVSAHGVPQNVVSDRGGHFMNDVWKCVCQRLGVTHSLSSAYHPETDGQTERMNRVLEEVLRCFVNSRHTDWDKWLPLAQFAINNSKQASTGFSPFYLNHGEHPRAPHVAHLPDLRVMRTVDEWVKHIDSAVAEAKQNLIAAQDRMAAYANQRRREVAYVRGDQVMLSTVNMSPSVGVKKLMPKYVGPFTVKHMVGRAAVRLELTDGYERLHDVFHVSLTKPWKARLGQEPMVTVAPIMIGAQPVMHVAAITGHKERRMTDSYRRKVTHWRVRWQGQDAQCETWEQAKSLPQSHVAVVQYYAERLGSDYVL